ncbi:MAG TPA: hypothetical protein VEH86_02905 [Candidatus Acidoferrum sp.]|nr:hypothetical protein [Candidatus Acidoferrum sp.]
MVDLSKLSLKVLVANHCRMLVALIGFLLSFLSLISPFCKTTIFISAGTYTRETDYYWTFKWEVHLSANHFNPASLMEYWFCGFWHGAFLNYSHSVSIVPVSLFIFEVLTVVFSIVSVFVKNRILSYLPIALSSYTLALMVIVSNLLFQEMIPPHTNIFGIPNFGEYQLGYYLLYPSIALFITAFLLNEWVKREQSNIPKQIDFHGETK